MGLSLFSVESLLTCKVFVINYWTQVLLCCALPVKTPFLDKFCAINPMIFSGIRQSICELYCWWYCHMGGPFKSSRNIKWASNESWMKKIIWTPNSIYDVSWKVLKSSGPHEFGEILGSFECWGVNEGTADMQHCWPYLACCMIDFITGCIWS